MPTTSQLAGTGDPDQGSATAHGKKARGSGLGGWGPGSNPEGIAEGEGSNPESLQADGTKNPRSRGGQYGRMKAEG